MAIWKKALLFLLCIVMALSLVACGGDDAKKDDEDDDEKETSSKTESLEQGDENCAHEWEMWQVERSRTCEKDGKESRECALCGKEETKVLVATGHDFGGDECYTCGKRTPSCKHKKSETVIIEEPTCENYGQRNSICKSCKGILNSEYLDPLGHDWQEFEGKEPTCTENGWYSYALCGICGMTNYEERLALGHNYFAGVCLNCEEVDAETGILTVPPVEKNVYTAVAGEENLLTAPSATIDVFTGEIKKDGQVVSYSFTPNESGIYRFWISELYSGNVLSIYVKNHLGEEIGSNWYCSNNDGMTATLEAGENYTVEVCQYYGKSTYQLNIGHQTPVADLSDYTLWSGNFEFIDQAFLFTYTPAISGIYSLTMQNMMSGSYASVRVVNRLGETICDESWLSNGSGVYGELNAGETYYITLYGEGNPTSVEMKVGKPKASVDVSDYNVIVDSLDYWQQINTYTFVASRETYGILFADGKDDWTDIYIEVFNRLGESMACDYYFSEGNTLNVAGLTVGETYTIKVGYRDDVMPYRLEIIGNKPTVEVEGKMLINDSMEYDSQYNYYRWTAAEDGEHTFYAVNLDGCVSIYIYNTDSDLLSYGTYCYSGDGTTLYDVVAGTEYLICVESCGYITEYTLAIQN